jgi:hypothetical protein
VFIFATWKNFPITGDFPRAEKRENEAVFNSSKNGQLVRNFLCYESYEKNPLGCFPYW